MTESTLSVNQAEVNRLLAPSHDLKILKMISVTANPVNVTDFCYNVHCLSFTMLPDFSETHPSLHLSSHYSLEEQETGPQPFGKDRERRHSRMSNLLPCSELYLISSHRAGCQGKKFFN